MACPEINGLVFIYLRLNLSIKRVTQMCAFSKQTQRKVDVKGHTSVYIHQHIDLLWLSDQIHLRN